MIWRALAMILAGASMKLVSPPIGIYQIHWFNLVLAFWALQKGDDKRNAQLMYLMGVSLLATNYSWISESVINFSNVPAILAWLCVALYAFVFAIPFALLGVAVHWLRERVGIYWIWLLPGLQVAIEQLWPALFPYYHGALFYRAPITWQWASVFGVTGVTYLIFLSTCVFSEILYRQRDGMKLFHPSYIMAGVIFVIHIIFGQWRYDSVEEELQDSKRLRVSFLQQNVTMQYRLERSPWISIRDWMKQTIKIIPEKPDLVVWPEGALGGPINPDDERPASVLGGRSLKQFFSEISSKNDFALLVGGGTVNFHDELDKSGFPTYTAYNSCYLFSRKGEITGRYDKMVPLPFGEYIPFSDTFPFLRDLIQGPGNFQPGKEVTYFNAKGKDFEYSFSTPICYEAILNRQMRKMADADLFINITNDAWFGDTACPHQHAMLTTVQAIEFGRPLYRLAYTGISFVVEPHGKILYETKPFEEVSSVKEIRMKSFETLCQRGGWIFPWLWVLVCPITYFRLRKKEEKKDPLREQIS
jgi:apolipoprotein N-acyltransferase